MLGVSQDKVMSTLKKDAIRPINFTDVRKRQASYEIQLDVILLLIRVGSGWQ